MGPEFNVHCEMNNEENTDDSKPSLSHLEIWFKSIYLDQNLYVSLETLKLFLKNDMNLKLEEMESQLSMILPYLVFVYLKKWPGWHFIKTDPKWMKTPMETLIYHLKMYVTGRIKYVIDKGYDQAMKAILEDHSNIKGHTIRFSPYSLQIKCPPSTINAIFFTEDNNDIIMKEHAERTLPSLAVAQLIHWPFVQVRFISPDLKFVRKQATEFIRYLNSTTHQYTISDKNIVESVETFNKSSPRACYTYRFISKYVIEYVKALTKERQNNKDIKDEDMEEIQIILDHFLQDIEDMKLNGTMATNTKVLFKLGNFKYARVKKMHRLKDTETSRVGYCEVFVPKIELCLNEFTGVEDRFLEDSSMFNLSNIRENSKGTLMPSITYTCTFCKEHFFKMDGKSAKDGLYDHLFKYHKLEQPIRCAMCKKEFEITELTNNRFKHNCFITL